MSDVPLPGLPHGEVQLSSWTPRWQALFEEEAERLRRALGPLASGVEHYGSTSVPGLLAKPILDILVGGPSPLEPGPYVAALAPLGYEFAPAAGVPEHLVFGRGRLRTHLVHVVEYEGSAWDRAIRFRDLLRTDAALAAAYADLKTSLAGRYSSDRAGYTAAKAEFIERALAGSMEPRLPRPLRYQEPEPMDRAAVEAALRGSDPTAICHALVAAARHDPDWAWVQEHCLRLLTAGDSDVRGAAATCLGHLARIHGMLDLERVEPRLRALRHDPDMGGRAEDALDDIARFIGTDG